MQSLQHNTKISPRRIKNIPGEFFHLKLPPLQPPPPPPSLFVVSVFRLLQPPPPLISFPRPSCSLPSSPLPPLSCSPLLLSRPFQLSAAEQNGFLPASSRLLRPPSAGTAIPTTASSRSTAGRLLITGMCVDPTHCNQPIPNPTLLSPR